MPLFDMVCTHCQHKTEYLISHDAKQEELACTNCGAVGELVKEMSVWSNYSISGNNSASTRPKRSK